MSCSVLVHYTWNRLLSASSKDTGVEFLTKQLTLTGGSRTALNDGWIHLQHTRIAVTFLRWNFFNFKPKNNKKSQRANATAICVCCKWIHPTIGYRRDEHGTHEHAHNSWILSPVLRVRSKTLHSLFRAQSLNLSLGALVLPDVNF